MTERERSTLTDGETPPGGNARRPEPPVGDLQVGVLVQGARAEVLYANRAALELLGMNADELLGRTSIDGGGLTIHEDGSSFPGAAPPGPRAPGTRTTLR